MKKVLKFEMKACDLDQGVACFNLAKTFRKDLDVEKTLTYLKKACDLKQGEACSYLADLYK